MNPIFERDNAAQVAMFNAYSPDAERLYFYHIMVDGKWLHEGLEMTDYEAREVCRYYVAEGAKNIMALKAIKESTYSFTKGAEYYYPATFALHPLTWIYAPDA